MTGVSGTNPAMDWEFVDRLRKLVSVKLLVKGIDGREDARLALDHGLDGVWVSNHGGRSTETLRSTIEALPEVVAEVGGRIPVFVDGGFRRGTDSIKRSRSAQRRWHWPSVPMGLGSLRASRRGPRARNHAGRVQAGDGKLRKPECVENHPGSRGDARLAQLTLSESDMFAEVGAPHHVAHFHARYQGEF